MSILKSDPNNPASSRSRGRLHGKLLPGIRCGEDGPWKDYSRIWAKWQESRPDPIGSQDDRGGSSRKLSLASGRIPQRKTGTSRSHLLIRPLDDLTSFFNERRRRWQTAYLYIDRRTSQTTQSVISGLTVTVKKIPLALRPFLELGDCLFRINSNYIFFILR